jgi:hypothetical protein
MVKFGATPGAIAASPEPDAGGDDEAAAPAAGEGAGAGERTGVGERGGAAAVDGGATVASGAMAIRVWGSRLAEGAAIMRTDRLGCEGVIAEGSASISCGGDIACRSPSNFMDGCAERVAAVAGMADEACGGTSTTTG